MPLQLLIVAATFVAPHVVLAAEVRGALQQWHRVELWFNGPERKETDTSPNPFLDYRLQCRFTAPSGSAYDVPGFFDTNGSGAIAGSVWKCRFSPDEVGQWRYTASFRAGDAVAVSLDAAAGTPAAFNGDQGTFTVSASDKAAPDFRAANRGRLEYTGDHYLRFRGSGKEWIKTGVNIPENFLGYAGFDNTPNAGHDFSPHAPDWKAGDPDWRDGNGRAIIGALNYLGSKGANGIYFLPMNLGGDGSDTFPTVSTGDKTHYDTSKLLQWEQVFTHCDRLGIFLHFQLAEREAANEEYFDGGGLGNQRKLFYRELIARFGHHLGVEWNVGEENNFGTTKQVRFAQHLRALDPYDHPVSNHTKESQVEEFYEPLLGNPAFTMTSFHASGSVIANIADWRLRSEEAGVPWVISFDEPHTIQNDPDDDDDGYPAGRADYLWPTLMEGAGGFEWYVEEDGGGHEFDQRIENFREMEAALVWSAYARDFFDRLPLASMQPRSDLSDAERTLADPGRVYALYSRDADRMRVDLDGVDGTFLAFWFSPETGTWQRGRTVTGGSVADLGTPPFSGDTAAIVIKSTDADVIGFCDVEGACSDGDACNGEEICEDGLCTDGTPLHCDDGDPCTIDDCDPSDGCTTSPAADGTPCDDGIACNGTETCNDGECIAAAVPCDDLNPCTTDSCANADCIHAPRPNGTACDDGMACTGNDRCSAGACVGDPVCPAGESCDPQSGACSLSVITLDGASTKRACAPTGSPVLSFDVTVRHATDRVLVAGFACEDARPGYCDFSLARASFGSVPMSLASVRSSDPLGWVASAAIYTLLDADIDLACASVYPCTRTLRVAMAAPAGQPDDLHGGAFVLANVAQRAPEATSHDGGDPCGGGLISQITSVTDGAWIVDVGAIGDEGPFSAPGAGQIARWTNDTCASSSSQSTTKHLPAATFTALTLDHGATSRCAHVLAAFAPAHPATCDTNADCSDGDRCNGTERCASDRCKLGTPLTCNDGNPCTADACHATAGCVRPPAADGIDCNDGNACTTSDECFQGSCGGTPIDCEDDGNPCTDETCDGAMGACITLANSASCDDGDACTIGDTCASGTCDGTSLDCDDGDACTIDACDPELGCTSAAIACPLGAECDPSTGACSGLDLVCVAADEAASLHGAMKLSAAFAGGSDVDPTTDSLTEALLFADSAINDMSGGSGDEARFTLDVPESGQWWLWARMYFPGEPGSNDANSFLVRLDQREAAKLGNNKDFFRDWHWDGNGEHEDGPPAALPLGTLAAGEHSLAIEKREVLPAGTQPRLDVLCIARDGAQPPDDARVRRLLGHCDVAADCNDDDACNGVEACSDGRCIQGAPLVCNDRNPCTIDTCDETLGCAATAQPDGLSCSDGAFCNGAETCIAGVCTPGEPPSCDDGNVCSVDACSNAGGCTHLPLTDGSCSDGNACNGEETCSQGTCVAGTPPSCDDHEVCTTDTCNPAIGCTHAALPDGTTCTDDDVCDGQETCAAGACSAGTALECDDGNECTRETCDAATGCRSTLAPDATACDDGLACTAGDACGGGVCQGQDTCVGGRVCALDGTCALPDGVAVDERSSQSACTLELDHVVVPVTIEDAPDKALVLTAGCSSNRPRPCELGDPRTVNFGGARMQPVGWAISDDTDAAVTSGIWYLLEADIDAECLGVYPCTRNVELDLRPLSSAFDALHIGTLLLFNVAQSSPEGFSVDGGDPCGFGLRTSVLTRTPGAFVLDAATAASAIPFGEPAAGQTEQLAIDACGDTSGQVTTREMESAGVAVMSLEHPSPQRCSHAVAVFGASTP